VLTRRRLPAALLVVGLLAVAPADAGHEISFYPSFYPQEIALEVADAPAAAARLQKSSLHAYLGADPFAGSTPPAHVVYAESLASYVVLALDRSRPGLADAAARCAAAARLLKTLSRTSAPGYRFHPYPITPYHDDYLAHFDLLEAARRKVDREAPGPRLRVRAKGALAEALIAGGARAGDGAGDATLEEVPISGLVAAAETRLNGWTGPPWMKEGWFHAYLLQAPAVDDARARAEIEAAFKRRVSGRADGEAVRVNAERHLVGLLTRGCERVAVGFTVRRQAMSAEYSEGIENVAYDAQGGLGSAIFLRTAKLKDFPWNGWLRLGVGSRPGAAWNPVAGFTDETGRLLWAAVGDPALLPAPGSAGWVANRVQPGQVTGAATGALEVPSDALAPDRASGVLRAVGPGTTASTKVVYRVLASAFHDGTKTAVADLLYPFVFAVRWSGNEGRGGRHDAAVEASTGPLARAVTAVRVLAVSTEVKDLGDVQVVSEIPQVEVYLAAAADPREAAAVAPPWSAVPWQLTVLMEEAVTRGLAAFSQAEAARRGVPWLDLARDRKLGEALASLADTFERRAYVPPPLRGLVTVEHAKQRWAALRRFHRQHGHLLVTNGPYQLGKWSSDAVVLTVFRDLTYPLGVGSFDRYAIPRKAYVTAAERRGDRLEIEAEVEKVAKFERSYKIVREPFRASASGESLREAPPAARYVIVGDDAEVAAAGASQRVEAGKLVVDLAGRLKPGAYRILLALALDDNRVDSEVKVVPYRVAD
jgi:hypothetical protein